MVPLAYLLFNKTKDAHNNPKGACVQGGASSRKASPPTFSTSRCSGVWRLVRCEYEALRRGATLVSTWLLWVLPVDIPRTTAWRVGTATTEYPGLPSFYQPAVAVWFGFSYCFFLVSAYPRPLHLVWPDSIYLFALLSTLRLILLIVSCHSLSLFIFNEPTDFLLFLFCMFFVCTNQLAVTPSKPKAER